MTMPVSPDEKYIDVESAVRLKEAEGKIEIEKYELETAAKFRELEITEDAKEVASKHLAKFAGLYLTFLVSLFIFSIKFVPESSLAVVAGLITLVVTNLSTILKHIVENGKKDKKEESEPAEKLDKVVEKN
jgi:hypothetical protein